MGDAAPSPETAPGGRPAPARPVAPVGAKRRRHQRWTRIATWATVAGVVVFGAFAVWAFRDWRTKSATNPDVEGTRVMLDKLAKEIRNFVEVRGRLPTAPFELRAPDLPSTFDALVWDSWKRPIEYRIVDEEKHAFRLRSLGIDGKPDTPDDLHWPANEPW